MDVYNAHFEILTLESVGQLQAAQCVLAFVEALVKVDCIYLQAYPHTPLLAQSGVRYRRQELGHDRWIDIPRMLETKSGSCDDLIGWRCAELLVRGENARPVLQVQDLGVLRSGQPFTLYHVLVQRADGSIEDPSRAHGMDHTPFHL